MLQAIKVEVWALEWERQQESAREVNFFSIR
jgi:hypothetical protein